MYFIIDTLTLSRLCRFTIADTNLTCLAEKTWTRTANKILLSKLRQLFFLLNYDIGVKTFN